jgi:gliding motility-associated lipoprotein GldH
LNSHSKIATLVLQVIAFTALLTFAACDDDVYYENNIHIESAQWNQDSALVFDVNIADSIQSFDFYLNIRHNNDYEFRNLFLFIHTLYPNTQYTSDTIEILMADASGKWYGEGFGDLKEVSILLKRGVYFPYPGNYKFNIVQAMRRENLQGIEDFGLRIELAE